MYLPPYAKFPTELSIDRRTRGAVKVQRLKRPQIIFAHVNTCRVCPVTTRMTLYSIVTRFCTTNCTRKTNAPRSAIHIVYSDVA